MLNIEDYRVLDSKYFKVVNYYSDPKSNFLHEDLYTKLGLLPNLGIAHKDLYFRLKALEPVLKYFGFKFIIRDSYRPREVQKLLWDKWNEYHPHNPRELNLADPNKGKGGPHNKAIAVDLLLTNNFFIPMPRLDTTVARKRSSHYHVPRITPKSKLSQHALDKGLKKEHLRDFMLEMIKGVGISSINDEYFHFQLPDYIDNTERSIEIPYAVDEARLRTYSESHEEPEKLMPCYDELSLDMAIKITNNYLKNKDMYITSVQKLHDKKEIEKVQFLNTVMVGECSRKRKNGEEVIFRPNNFNNDQAFFNHQHPMTRQAFIEKLEAILNYGGQNILYSYISHQNEF